MQAKHLLIHVMHGCNLVSSPDSRRSKGLQRGHGLWCPLQDGSEQRVVIQAGFTFPTNPGHHLHGLSDTASCISYSPRFPGSSKAKCLQRLSSGLSTCFLRRHPHEEGGPGAYILTRRRKGLFVSGVDHMTSWHPFQLNGTVIAPHINDNRTITSSHRRIKMKEDLDIAVQVYI